MKFLKKRVTTLKAQFAPPELESKLDYRTREALRKLEEFCRKIGGTLYVPGYFLVKGERPPYADCFVPRRLSARDLAEAISELTTKLRDVVKEAVGELGVFSIIDGPEPTRRTWYRPGPNTVEIEHSMSKTYPLGPEDIEEVYYRPVVDEESDSSGTVSVSAHGRLTSIGLAEAWAHGSVKIEGAQKPETIAEKIRKMYAMMEEILSNPLNFFKLRGRKETKEEEY